MLSRTFSSCAMAYGIGPGVQNLVPIMMHELKTWPTAFQAIWDGTKPFELRRNDRGFRVGDSLHLREWDTQDIGAPFGGVYTGRSLVARITYVLTDGYFPGLQPGFAVLGLKVETRTLPTAVDPRQTSFSWAV
jgi:hypothetical protein